MAKWSISTINSLRRCNRQYYFAHVAANHGRKNAFRREAYELKRMQNFLMWPGSVVDKFIETEIIPNIKNLDYSDFETLAEKAVQMAKEQYAFSKKRLFSNPDVRAGDHKQDFAILQMHKLNEEYSEDDTQVVYDKIYDAVRKFPDIVIPANGTKLLDFLKEASWLLPNVMNWSFNVESSRVSPQIDLFLIHQNKPVIIDWKLSESFVSDYSRQLIICALSVMNWYKNRDGQNPDMEDYSLYEINLLKESENVTSHELNVERASEIIDYINLTGSDIELLLGDRKYEEIDIEEFDITDKDTTCAFCNFKSLCAKVLINGIENEKATFNKHVSNLQFEWD
ncbi:PD-(D/E)XK nuclease family protein [Roseivirga sp. UBA838]|uniref:PD-(D/E)XK nuclease family protein n=1 Tax=Roseivirga sp. UBA838 TaxID=1947393 RepID=UPI00257C4A8B|nr:PD-(D/E)XK nuclease family protein [Roseivirga sp. UBA838]|tara:strand:- start:35652 stop:36668 length:1017 start_codon:yes stop_codon:yes gene_type:complete